MLLANDVFSVFAPKITLKQAYYKLIVSGKPYKGWTTHDIEAATQIAPLAESEMRKNPRKQQEIKQQIIEGFTKYFEINDISSSSEKATPASDQLRRKLGLKPEDMVIEYIYDDCLKERFYVKGKGPRHFYLSRPIKNTQLANILRRLHGIIPESLIIENHKNSIAYCRNPSLDKIDAGQKRGNPTILTNGATTLAEGEKLERNMPRAIELCRDAANLGVKRTARNLGILVFNYAEWLYNDVNDKDILRLLGFSGKRWR